MSSSLYNTFIGDNAGLGSMGIWGEGIAAEGQSCDKEGP